MRILTMGVLFLSACAPTVGSVDPDPVAGGPLVIPVAPMTEVVGSVWLDSSRPHPDPVAVDGTLTLGLGPDYPTELTLLPADIWEGRCLWEGTFTPAEVRSSDSAVLSTRLEGDQVLLRVGAAGTASVQVVGAFDGGCAWDDTDPGTRTVLFDYDVRVLAPSGARLTPGMDCGPGAPLVVTESSLPRYTTLTALDDRGEPISLANAREDRQVSLTLVLPPGTRATLPGEGAGVEEVVFHGGGGEVELRGPGGVVEVFDVVPVSAVDAMELALVVPAGGGREGDLFLEDGGTYAWSDIVQVNGRTVLGMAGRPQVDGVSACGVPHASVFELDTEPASAAIGEDWQTWSTAGLHFVGLGVTDLRSGTLDLTLAAPATRDGEGIVHELTVTFTE